MASKETRGNSFQCRMQCNNLKGDLHSLHVVDDPVCICSNQTENCEHFFFIVICMQLRVLLS